MTSRRSIGIGAVLVASISLGMALSLVHSRKTNVHGVGWYTSFADALMVAKQTHKPVLLLSMFGRLDEDMPCANARTLRATLFNDPEFKALITKDVVPAWEMVRPVPHVTIDLGDGKSVTRTVRGNAVMYLCNPDGKVVDAFPGVYTAKDFLPMIHESIDALANADTATVLKYHKDRGHMIPMTMSTLSKAVLETPTLAMIGQPKITVQVDTTGSISPERFRFLSATKQLSDLSLTPMSPNQAVTTVTGSPIEGRTQDEIVKQVLQNDSATNLTRVRPVIHLWLASETALPTPEQARDTVLQTILKIPFKDPYFGLKDVILPGTPG